MNEPSPSRSPDDTTTRYLNLARDYATAAASLSEAGIASKSPAAFSHLAAHAFELTLKAAVAIAPHEPELLISLGHDLAFCLRAAERQGFCLGPDEAPIRAVVDALSGDHHAQSYRYPTRLRWVPVDPAAAIAAVQAAIAAVEASSNDVFQCW